ncbi:DNA (cytosine-5-)-methyltransferase [Clostridium botulinum]|uniref:DNA (cytosine-5-)-methyltransferase n=1 Tax=Clostridium botulinum TaxID=1491 RepID=UPI0019681C84|nr:DNA (cytosine-5-)-methyltransferase [Clostridium botulinum]
MNVLSLFDGISCGQIALNKVGIKIDNYYASEIKEHAIKVTQHNYPNTIQLGDVTKIDLNKLPKIDLLIGGSPCQDLSIAMKNREGLKGSKSSLFWEYVKVLQKVKPKYFLLENVARMSNEDKEIINGILGVEPIRINSRLVSAQLRDRLYWTNIPGIKQPQDKGILLKDILESGYTDREKSRALLVSDSRPLRDKKRMWHRYKNTGFTTIVFESEDMNPENIRYLTQIELERLQTVPVGYTQILKRDQAADVLGDGWTVDAVAHIFSYMEKEIEIEKAI